MNFDSWNRWYKYKHQKIDLCYRGAECEHIQYPIRGGSNFFSRVLRKPSTVCSLWMKTNQIHSPSSWLRYHTPAFVVRGLPQSCSTATLLFTYYPTRYIYVQGIGLCSARRHRLSEGREPLQWCERGRRTRWSTKVKVQKWYSPLSGIEFKDSSRHEYVKHIAIFDGYIHVLTHQPVVWDSSSGGSHPCYSNLASATIRDKPPTTSWKISNSHPLMHVIYLSPLIPCHSPLSAFY